MSIVTTEACPQQLHLCEREIPHVRPTQLPPRPTRLLRLLRSTRSLCSMFGLLLLPASAILGLHGGALAPSRRLHHAEQPLLRALRRRIPEPLHPSCLPKQIRHSEKQCIKVRSIHAYGRYCKHRDEQVNTLCIHHSKAHTAQ